jgi:hypothetical protein
MTTTRLQNRCRLRHALVLSTLLAILPASAETLPKHECVALPVDDTLTLSAAIDIGMHAIQ